LRPCLATGSTNSARVATIVTATLRRQYSQTELIFWITLVNVVFVLYDWGIRMHLVNVALITVVKKTQMTGTDLFCSLALHSSKAGNSPSFELACFVHGLTLQCVCIGTQYRNSRNLDTRVLFRTRKFVLFETLSPK
jgi:hypothetical protein